MNLSEHFTLAECVRTQVRVDNTPDPETVEKMKDVCANILERVRSHFGKPVVINSFYRSPAVNSAVGSHPNSQHIKGEAVDFEVPGVSNDEVARWVRDNLIFDQCIREFAKVRVPESGWVHVSYRRHGCRAECWTINENGTIPGLPTIPHY